MHFLDSGRGQPGERSNSVLRLGAWVVTDLALVFCTRLHRGALPFAEKSECLVFSFASLPSMLLFVCFFSCSLSFPFRRTPRTPGLAFIRRADRCGDPCGESFHLRPRSPSGFRVSGNRKKSKKRQTTNESIHHRGRYL